MTAEGRERLLAALSKARRAQGMCEGMREGAGGTGVREGIARARDLIESACDDLERALESSAGPIRDGERPTTSKGGPDDE